LVNSVDSYRYLSAISIPPRLEESVEESARYRRRPISYFCRPCHHSLYCRRELSSSDSSMRTLACLKLRLPGRQNFPEMRQREGVGSSRFRPIGRKLEDMVPTVLQWPLTRDTCFVGHRTRAGEVITRDKHFEPDRSRPTQWPSHKNECQKPKLHICYHGSRPTYKLRSTSPKTAKFHP